MSEREETLKKYIGDMIAVERYINDAATGQIERGRFQGFPEAESVVRRIEQVTETHCQALESELQRLGGEPTKGIKETVTGAVGSVTDMVQSLRSEERSKMLRDHYTALSLTKVSYITLHTTALTLKDSPLGALALSNMGEVPTLLSEIESCIVRVTAGDVRESVPEADLSAADIAEQNIREAA